eukprot:GHVU01168063.1.p1 GENE.GHVU01168063.1~~GHVU01168063.1.p1  ORF type:complete len:110 (+),score=16.93 GHVU01168063.1:46-330(+)
MAHANTQPPLKKRILLKFGSLEAAYDAHGGGMPLGREEFTEARGGGPTDRHTRGDSVTRGFIPPLPPSTDSAHALIHSFICLFVCLFVMSLINL